jgi:hypothetical protein
MDIIDDIVEDKLTVTVEHEGQRHIVSWYRDTSEADVREAFLCACDAIADTGFTLYDSSGFPVQLQSVRSGEVYSLTPGQEIQGLEKVLGDRWRRVNVEVSPLQHLEATRGLEVMQRGTNLLKHTRRGLPHIRMFQLTADLKNLVWFSANKTHFEACVPIVEITELITGQSTSVFQRYPLPMLSHLSFTLCYSKQELNVTCKDEREFDLWVAGLKALMYDSKGLMVSKQVLLSHSHRFLEALKQNKLATATSVIFAEASSKRLEDCIVRRQLTPLQIMEKLRKAHQRLIALSHESAETDSSAASLSKKAYGSDYVELGIDDEEEEVCATQQARFAELINHCQQRLLVIESGFNDTGTMSPERRMQLENELWLVEIDIENANDILKRVEDQRKPGLGSRLKSWFRSKLL